MIEDKYLDALFSYCNGAEDVDKKVPLRFLRKDLSFLSDEEFNVIDQELFRQGLISVSGINATYRCFGSYKAWRHRLLAELQSQRKG